MLLGVVIGRFGLRRAGRVLARGGRGGLFRCNRRGGRGRRARRRGRLGSGLGVSL